MTFLKGWKGSILGLLVQIITFHENLNKSAVLLWYYFQLYLFQLSLKRVILHNYIITIIGQICVITTKFVPDIYWYYLKYRDGGIVPKRNKSENEICHKPVSISKILPQPWNYIENLTHTGLQPKVLIPKFWQRQD